MRSTEFKLRGKQLFGHWLPEEGRYFSCGIPLLFAPCWYHVSQFHAPFLFRRSSELLDALTKNGSSAGNGAYRRRPAESSEHAGAHQDKEGQEPGAVDASKGFTKEQVEGVQRWEVLFFFYNCISPLCLLAASFEPAVVAALILTFVCRCSNVHTLPLPWEPSWLGVIPVRAESER